MSDGKTKAKSKYSVHYEKYILAIDNQRKASFVDRDAAVAAGKRIVEAHTVVRVVIIDRDTGEETLLSAQ
ncbi:MAG: hypothetical protein Q8M31_19790 [Beijerinckiaceae bacterium]|nr:hypothetical protein [Beijerinckiaceae bacterium]